MNDTRPSAIAIILARAGSKGLPGKNRMPIAGKPCAIWTIEAAAAARSVALTVLSTDDDELARHARNAGIRVIARPLELAADNATVDDAARHAVVAIDQAQCSLDSDLARRLDPIVILYANVPVRPAGLIDRAVDLLTRTGCDSVQSYQPVGKHHPWWTARVDPHGGRVSPWEGDVLNHGVFRRQDLPAAYIPDGGVIVVTRRALFRTIPGVADGPHAFFGADRRGVINPEGSVVDIDAPTDALVADAILAAAANPGRAGRESRS